MKDLMDNAEFLEKLRRLILAHVASPDRVPNALAEIISRYESSREMKKASGAAKAAGLLAAAAQELRDERARRK